jgi:hypothetical protein
MDGAARGAGTVIRKVLRKSTTPKVIPPLRADQLNHVRQVVLEAAADRGLSPQRASTIADAVATRLTLPDARDAAGEQASHTEIGQG